MRGDDESGYTFEADEASDEALQAAVVAAPRRFVDGPPRSGLEDASPWLQAQLDSGGHVELPPGRFLLGSPLETDRAGVSITGAGGGRFGGATRLLVPDGQWGFKFNVGGAAQHDGPVLRDFAVEAASGVPAGGVWLGNAGHCLVERVSVRGCDVGLRVGDATSQASQYVTVRDPIVSECGVGIDVADSNGLRLFGGVVEHYGGGPLSIPSGTAGVRVGPQADTFRAFGTVVQYVETGFDVQGWAAQLHGVRSEGCTVHVDVQREFFEGYGLQANNSIVGGGGTAFRLGPSVRRATLHGTATAVGTLLDDQRPNKSPPSPHDWCDIVLNGHSSGVRVEGQVNVGGKQLVFGEGGTVGWR